MNQTIADYGSNNSLASPWVPLPLSVCPSAVGASGRKALRNLDLTVAFQGTATRALRGLRPLNSNR